TVGSAGIDFSLTVTDADNATLASATVSIISFSAGDVLLFYANATNYGNITPVYNNSTGVLTLNSTGATATLAQWQAALRSIRLSASSNGNTRTINYAVSDGALNSATASKIMNIPALISSNGSTPYMAGGVVVDDAVSITNANNNSITSATVGITTNRATGDALVFTASATTYGNITSAFDSSTGLLTLSSAGNTATVAQWEIALRSVTFIAATNDNVRTVTFTINGSNTATKLVKSTLDFITVWDMSKPSVGSATSISFRMGSFGINRKVKYTWTTVPASSFSGSGELPSLTILQTTSIGPLPENMLVQISFQPENLRGFGMWDATTDKAQFVDIKAWGSARWESLIGLARESINFNMTAKDVPDLSAGPSLQYLFIGCTSFTGKETNMSTWNTSVVPNMLQMFAGATLFNHNISSWNVANVTTMNSAFSGARSFNQNLGSWQLNANADLAGMLSNSGLDCTNYSSTLIAWSQASVVGRTLNAGGLKYGENAVAVRNILTTPIADGGKGWTIIDDILNSFNCPNSPPMLTSSTGYTSYTSGIVVVDNMLTLTDADNNTLASATVSIANNHAVGDVLTFTPNAIYGNIISTYNSATGVLSLSSADATATISEWQAALRSVTFQTTSNTNNRTISFSASDGVDFSAAATKRIEILSNFITTWDLSKTGNSPTQISFNATVAGGGANYTWTTVPASANSGSGSIPDGNNIVANIT
ncbi:MAG: BspA family leucine-rich repeat surface protein, partial [Pedobacter sp.]